MNDAATITVTPESLVYAPWVDSLDYTVTVSSDWDASKGESFRIQYGFEGTNAASYLLGATDYVKFTIL